MCTVYNYVRYLCHFIDEAMESKTEESRIDFGQDWILIHRNIDQNASVANLVFSRYCELFFF